MKKQFASVKEKMKSASAATGEKLTKAGNFAKESAKTIATSILDQDGDGKLDQADLKIMTEKGTELAKKALKEAGEVAKEASKSDLVKEATAGAAVGAAIAIPVPLIGPAAGAVIGAAVGTYKSVTKKK